jgi:hypothetical protein
MFILELMHEQGAWSFAGYFSNRSIDSIRPPLEASVMPKRKPSECACKANRTALRRCPTTMAVRKGRLGRVGWHLLTVECL